MWASPLKTREVVSAAGMGPGLRDYLLSEDQHQKGEIKREKLHRVR